MLAHQHSEEGSRRLLQLPQSCVRSLPPFPLFCAAGPPVALCRVNSSSASERQRRETAGRYLGSPPADALRKVRSRDPGAPLFGSLSLSGIDACVVRCLILENCCLIYSAQVFVSGRRINSFPFTPSWPEGKSMNEPKSLLKGPIYLQACLSSS